MQKHTKVYFNFFGYDESSYIECEMECGSRAVDIHHLIKRSKIGGKQERDHIENLVGLCRDCHIQGLWTFITCNAEQGTRSQTIILKILLDCVGIAI